jgi:methionyl-tRNA formyltransferase
VRFGPIDSYVWFGAGGLLLESVVRLRADGHRVAVFSSARHLGEAVDADGTTRADALAAAGVPAFDSEDINAEPRLAEHVGERTLGVSMGPAWIFGPEVCARFGERFVNFMGIDLPRYRGGAHYTWQILQGNRLGSVNLQLINPVVDSGAIVKHHEYRFPPTARLPRDYFATAGPIERAFLAEFLDEVARDADFAVSPIQEKYAQHFPYLHTVSQGLVDWSWDVGEIERFVCAFDDPYPGASTFYEGRRVFLHDAVAERGDGPFHPFLAGLVYGHVRDGVAVACRGGTLVVGRAVDEDGADVTAELRAGRRLVTPSDALDEAMAFRAVYTAEGLKRAPA